MNYDEVKIKFFFGLEVAKLKIYDDEQVVATVIVDQDPDALRLLKDAVAFMTREDVKDE